MANSYVEYTSLSGTTYATPNFLNINDINVKGYNGSTWTTLTISSRNASAKTITLSAAPSSYQKIRVYRSTTANPLVDFTKGATLTESDLDSAYNQGLYVAQEVSEDAGAVGTLVNNNQTLNGTTTVDNLTATGTVTLPNSSISNDNLAGSIASSKLAGGIDITTQITGYQTGTWTPAISISGSDVVDQTNSTKDYTKIGRVVFVTGHIVLDGAIPNGNFTITGLPFTCVTRGIMSLNSRDETNSFAFASKLMPNQFVESSTEITCNTEVALDAGDRINITGYYFTS